MKRCKLCLYPDTKPDLHFDADGVCSACTNFANRPTVDWEARKVELLAILDHFGGRVAVASSGGKDSTYIVLRLLELGAKPIILTASTCYLTKTGRYNIDNLARYATTIEFTPNREVRAKLNRFGLELVGDISWPEHAQIFSTPIRIAEELGIGALFYGENPQREYGGPLGSEQAKTMNARWISEFGGFLGLRTADFVGREGITEEDMADYEVGPVNCEVYFLGQFEPWDSHRNAERALDAGMLGWLPAPCQANWWPAENLDNAMTGLHDHFMFRKYGYGRGVAQISIDIRNGLVAREKALAWAKANDGKFPHSYCGVLAAEVIEHIGMKWTDFLDSLERHTNWELFERTEDVLNPRLREEFWQ